MDPDLKWMIGISVSILLAWLSILAGAFWKIMGIIRRVERDSQQADEHLHARVNRMREDTVHKADLHDLGVRLSADMKEMRQEHRDATTATNNRLDALLAAIANRNHGDNR